MRRLLISLIILAGVLLVCGGRTFARPSNQTTPVPCTQGTPHADPNIAVVVLLQNSKHMDQAQPDAATTRMTDARRAAIGLASVLNSQQDAFGLVTYSQNPKILLPLAQADGGCVANAVDVNGDGSALVDLTKGMQQAIDMLTQSHAKRNVLVIIGASCEDTNLDKSLPADALSCKPNPDMSKKIIDLSPKIDLSIYAIGVGHDGAPADRARYFVARHDELKAYANLLSPANPSEGNYFVAYNQDNPEWYAFLRMIVSNPTSVPATPAPPATPTPSATPTPPATPTPSATPSPESGSEQNNGSIWGLALVAFFAGLLLAGVSAFVIMVRAVQPSNARIGATHAPRIARKQPLLVIRNGIPDAKHDSYLLTRDSISIGSDVTNTIQLPEVAGVRKQHLVLERITNADIEDNRYRVTVVSSSSEGLVPASINNKPIQPSQSNLGLDAQAELALNDLLTVGEVLLQYVAWPVALQPPTIVERPKQPASEMPASTVEVVE